MPRRADAHRLGVWAQAPWVLLLCGTAGAQVTPVFTAPLVHPTPAAVEAPPAEPLTAERIVSWFEQACVATRGESGPAIDWALENGFQPVDPMRGSTDHLLGGEPGTVLVAPGSDGQVMLATAASQCSVWAERQEGPPLRQALAAMVGTLTAKGARARVEVERNLERSGAWRSQVQWRYRGVGASHDLGIGAVTTLAAGAGTQMLHVAPLARTAGFAPDGTPLR